MSSTRLSELEAGARTTVERVYEEDEDLLRFFHDEGILPGTPVSIIEVAPYRGTMTVNFGRSDLVLGLEAARQIWVPE